MISKEDMQELTSTKKSVISEETMLGKVFNCFFNDRED